MRLKIDRETLLKGVGRTLGVVDRRGTMPILANFLLQTDENRVVISATDLEVSFRATTRQRFWSTGPSPSRPITSSTSLKNFRATPWT